MSIACFCPAPQCANVESNANLTVGNAPSGVAALNRGSLVRQLGNIDIVFF